MAFRFSSLVDMQQLEKNVDKTIDVIIADISKKAGAAVSLKGYSGFSDGKNYACKKEYLLNGLHDDAKLVTVFFEPGDKTGNPDGTPRAKEGYAELLFPVGTQYNRHFAPFLLSLEGKTIIDNAIMTDKHFGSRTALDYCYAIEDIHETGRASYFPRMGEVTFFEKTEGNPHAITFNEEIIHKVNSFPQEWIQIAAFLHLPTKTPQADRLVLQSRAQDTFSYIYVPQHLK